MMNVKILSKWIPKEGITVKIVRRLIMVIALISLIPSMISLFASLKSDIPKDIRHQIKVGSAKQIELNKVVSLDQDKIKFKQLIITETETLLIYEVRTKEPGWTFPDTSLQLRDKQGNVYQYDGGSSSGESWGQLAINHYERLPKETKIVVLDFNWYDRSFQTELTLEQEDL
jgi:hypothetical protein